MSGTRSNDARQSEQIGTRLALVNSVSQMHHPAGKNTHDRVADFREQSAHTSPPDFCPAGCASVGHTKQKSKLIFVLIKKEVDAAVTKPQGRQ
jgi:hypothetical protein